MEHLISQIFDLCIRFLDTVLQLDFQQMLDILFRLMYAMLELLQQILMYIANMF